MLLSINKIKSVGKAFKEILKSPNYARSYAQSGEDIIVSNIMRTINIKSISYLDIGAHHPVYLSNTYLFYTKNNNGVCVEPNPVLCAYIKKKRPRDTCLEIGIGTQGISKTPFYIMEPASLSTFSKEGAGKMQAEKSAVLKETREIKLENINSIIESYFKSTPDFISIDVEGLDIDILESLDFKKFRPKVFCIETLTFSPTGNGQKITAIFDIMKKNGYKIYADTYINTIFVEQSLFDKL